MESSIIAMKQQRLVELLGSLAPTENLFPSMLDEVKFFRINKSSPRKPMAYAPNILILAQGQKRVFPNTS